MTPNEVFDLRARLGLTQEAFARTLGVALHTVQRWEGGVHRPHPIMARQMLRLARRHGVKIGAAQ